jgi:hypothetical protein
VPVDVEEEEEGGRLVGEDERKVENSVLFSSFAVELDGHFFSAILVSSLFSEFVPNSNTRLFTRF